jgi:NADH-quinone oxidoreductase subunit J
MLLAPVTAQMVSPSEVPVDLGPRIVFWVIATLVLGGAVLTITRRNAVAAVMALVATFFGLAAAFAMLSAHFLAAIQVLVYAGAIMVLFIFVVMVLNRDETEPWAWRGFITKMIGIAVTAYTVIKLAGQLMTVTVPHPEAPPPEFGTVAAVGEVLFTDYVFAFEAVSILLVIAVIAAVVVGRARPEAAREAEDPASEAAETH